MTEKMAFQIYLIATIKCKTLSNIVGYFRSEGHMLLA